ncbi:PfkB family carbohydrate kinase [Paenibacillus sp. y28]|uniref:PfkB family carbohydrate kinase n=1 Tax=Paenibacillus sp. y28 TaxID=3129110 RepID=UPI0030169AFF
MVTGSTVVCIGELLIDFVPEENGLPLAEVPLFRKAAGGAPANVAAAVAKLGGASRFIGKIGADPFGQFLRETLVSAKVDPALVETGEARTGLAFVSLRADGERDFLFYRQPAADMLLHSSELQDAWFADAAILHFGGVSLIHEPCRSATLAAAERARRLGALVSYDPNVRMTLWGDDTERARCEMLAPMAHADVVKVSEEEIHFLTGTEDLLQGAHQLLEQGPQVIVATLGAEGSRFITSLADIAVPAPRVNAIDTTGAGDGFVGGLLYQLTQWAIAPVQIGRALADEGFVREIGRFASAVGALTTTRRGAIPALPTREEVERALD